MRLMKESLTYTSGGWQLIVRGAREFGRPRLPLSSGRRARLASRSGRPSHSTMIDWRRCADEWDKIAPLVGKTMFIRLRILGYLHADMSAAGEAFCAFASQTVESKHSPSISGEQARSGNQSHVAVSSYSRLCLTCLWNY